MFLAIVAKLSILQTKDWWPRQTFKNAASEMEVVRGDKNWRGCSEVVIEDEG